MARFWDILTVTAVTAFLISGVFAAISLLFLGVGLLTGQLIFAGLAEMLISYVFLAVGVAMLYAVSHAARRSSEPAIERVAFIFSGLLFGVCCIIIGISALASPEILTFLLDA
jgi:hypothetical protein